MSRTDMHDNDPPVVADKATDRLLTVFETIAQSGPVTLAHLTEATGLPRSAVHRAAQILQRRGWVRARLSDHAYAVSSRFDDAIADARYAHEEAEVLSPLMTSLAHDWTCFVDIGLFTSRGVFEVVDSTDRKMDLNNRSLVHSTIATAAQVALRPTGRVRHLDAFLERATDAEAEFVTSGRHFRQMKAAEDHMGGTGVLIQEDTAALAPFTAPSGAVGVLRLRPRRVVALEDAAKALRNALDRRGCTLRREEDPNKALLR